MCKEHENESETSESPEDDLENCNVNTTLDNALYVGRILLVCIAICVAFAALR
jgi:hypothetical protein